MDNKGKVIIGASLVACLLLGAGIEWVYHTMTEEVPEPETVTTKVVAAKPTREIVTVKDSAAEKEVEVLRKRIAELEGMVANRRSNGQQENESEEDSEEARRQRGQRRREEWQRRMEQMKQDDPEGYAEMVRRREEGRQRFEQRERQRNELLAAVDTTNFTAQQKQNHEKLLNTLNFLSEIRQNGENGGEVDEQTRQQIGEAFRSLGELYNSERDALLASTAKAAGYSGNEVNDFVEQVKAIYDNTSMGFGGPGFGGPGGRGGRGGPGFGGPGGGNRGGNRGGRRQ